MSNLLSDASIQHLKQVSLDAGAAILAVYALDEHGIEIKTDDSPLTLADQASNEVICNALKDLDEQYPIVSEENKDIPYTERASFDTFWLVDPLDGTKEFIKRNGEFTVNIALVHKGRPVAGFVYAPVLDEMYSAVEGMGAFLDKEGSTTQLSVSEFHMGDPHLNVVCSRSHLNEETQAFIDALDAPEKVSKGSSLKFLMLAKGEAQLYPRIAPTMEWDTCAAQCVLEQAGGCVVEYGTDQPLLYNKESLLNPYFLASGKITA